MGWKIVRDRHRETAAEYGISGSWRTVKHPVNALGKKLFEEAAEFTEDYDPRELYDLRDVVDELIRLTDPFGVHKAVHQVKVAKNGLFSSHLEWSPNPHELFYAVAG